MINIPSFKKYNGFSRINSRQAARSALTGQIMIEAIVALTLLVFGTLGIYSLISSSLSLTRTTGNQYVAANLAMEGIEVVKNLLDRNIADGDPTTTWNSGLTGCQTTAGGCSVAWDSLAVGSSQNSVLKFDNTTGLYNYSSGRNTTFKRLITIDSISADELKIVSDVSWTDRNNISFNVKLENRAFNWRVETQ